MSVCQGCGGPLPTRKSAGRPRKWCSDNCRKRRWDHEHRRSPCIECGAVSSTVHAHDRCEQCNFAHRRAEHEALLDRVEQMWNAGMLGREIGAALGRKPQKDAVSVELDELRKLGRVGYRYKAYERKAAA